MAAARERASSIAAATPTPPTTPSPTTMDAQDQAAATALAGALSTDATARAAAESVLLASLEAAGHCGRLLRCSLLPQLPDAARLRRRGDATARPNSAALARRRPRNSGRRAAGLESGARRDDFARRAARGGGDAARARVRARDARRGEQGRGRRAPRLPPRASPAAAARAGAARGAPHRQGVVDDARRRSDSSRRASPSRCLPELEAPWAAAVDAVATAGEAAAPHQLRLAALHTKVLRQLLERLADGGGADAVRAAALGDAALRGAAALHRLGGGALWDRLGSAFGKLLAALARGEGFPGGGGRRVRAHRLGRGRAAARAPPPARRAPRASRASRRGRSTARPSPPTARCSCSSVSTTWATAAAARPPSGSRRRCSR